MPSRVRWTIDFREVARKGTVARVCRIYETKYVDDTQAGELQREISPNCLAMPVAGPECPRSPEVASALRLAR